MRLRVYPYRQGSRSARELAAGLGGRVLRLQGSRFRKRQDDVIINWGSTEQGQREFEVDYNTPYAVIQASNKLTFFREMPEDLIPPFWEQRQEIPEDAYPVVCRTVLAGHSGAGIVVANTPMELVDARLYVKYIKKQEEFRIHVGKVDDRTPVIISEQRKARRLDVPDDQVDWQIRNHQNGFVFAREGIEVPECVREAAKRALLSLPLDFGAVDVIYNRHQDRAYVLEVNTAPGLEGQTVDDYVNFFATVIR